MHTLFRTECGIKIPAVTSDQMREIDRIAVEETGPNLYQMMENAGRNLMELTIELLGQPWNKARVMVLAGTGGNGGGGICGARHLSNHNVDVTLCLANPDRLGDLARFQYKIYQSAAGKEIRPRQLKIEKFDIIIDALVGYGLKGTPKGAILDLIRWTNSTSSPILSLDVPSGVDATTGKTLKDFVQATWTMTLALPKCGLQTGNTNQIYLADIGIPVKIYERIGLNYTSPFDRRSVIPLVTTI